MLCKAASARLPESALGLSDPLRGDLWQGHSPAPPSPGGAQPASVSEEACWGRSSGCSISVQDWLPRVDGSMLSALQAQRVNPKTEQIMPSEVIQNVRDLRPLALKWPRVVAAHVRNESAGLIAITTCPTLSIPDKLATMVRIAFPVFGFPRISVGVIVYKASGHVTAQGICQLIPALLCPKPSISKARVGDDRSVTTFNVIGACIAPCAATINVPVTYDSPAAASGNPRVLPAPIDRPIRWRSWAVGQHFRREGRTRSNCIHHLKLLACAAAQGDAYTHIHHNNCDHHGKRQPCNGKYDSCISCSAMSGHIDQSTRRRSHLSSIMYYE